MWALWTGDAPNPEAWGAGEVWNGRDPFLVALGGRAEGQVVPLSASPAADAQPAATGAFQPLFGADFYNRLHLSVTVLALGNVVGDQFRQVSVWNAYGYGVAMTALQLLNAEGITIAGQAPAPLAFGPLQEREWTVTVAGEGSPTIDAAVVWTFSGGAQLRLTITGNRITPWTWLPDWSRSILEALEWRTDIIEAEEGDEQRIALRVTPRQTWEFTATGQANQRQAMEAAMLGWGARVWALPLWPHGATLTGAVAAGATELLVPTLAREFAAGGLALVLSHDGAAAEVVELDSVEADRIVLRRPLLADWPSGGVVFPAKAARLTDASLARFTGACADAQVRFEVAQANPYAADIDLPLYRGLPVLEYEPDWSTAPTLAARRKVAEIDNDVGVPVWIDRAGFPTLRQVLRYAPLGRAQLDAHRRLLYALRGRQRPLWVPSFADDVTLRVLAADGATNIDVAAFGYTTHLRHLQGRTDIRIESDQGVQYRRIMGSVELGGGLERLGLDSPLSWELNPATDDVMISFLALYRLDSDRIEWEWWSGDLGGDNAHADTPFPIRTFRHDL